MGKLVYNIFLLLYSFGIRIASIWNPKAKKWLEGRRDLFNVIHHQIAIAQPDFLDSGTKRIWMHCASLGEFEQGRPLIESIRFKHPDVKIILTFFSPSGYEVMKDYTGADFVFYLPMDGVLNAKKFIAAINPSLVLWVKYEFWYYYLTALKQNHIPVILVSGIFRPHQPFFKWYGAIWREMLDCFDHFFVQNDSSKHLLESISVNQSITINGDTRFDRVLEIAHHFVPFPLISAFCGNSQVIVAGSTWEEDEVELLHFIKMHPAIKFIMAPHEIDEEHLAEVKKVFPRAVYYSELESMMRNGLLTTNLLIIDNIGMLSQLYQYASIAFIGGGFGAEGVHNVLEAAVYGKPVVFGPVYEKYDEAIGLIEAGGGISINSGPIELELALNELLADEAKRRAIGEAAANFVKENSGASNKIIHYIQEKRLLTS